MIKKNLPHDSINHLHDNLIDNVKEVNNNASFFSKGSKDSSKSQTEENNSQSVGARSVGHLFLSFVVGCIGLDSNFRNLDMAPQIEKIYKLNLNG